MKTLRTACLLVFLLLSLFEGMSQGPTAHWYFGYGSGIRFTNGIPAHITNSAMSYAPEGTAVHSYDNGKLMFYGSPNTIYDSTHQVIPNGAGLNGSFSATQGALIIPKPLDSNVFYYITQSGATHDYSIIRKTAANPLGEVAANELNLPLAAGTTEKTTAVHHANGKDIWVITRLYQADSILAFLVDENGLNTTPVVSHVPTTAFGFAGQMKSSPDGRFLSDCGTVGSWQYPIQAFIHQFDNETGLVTETVMISDSSLVTYGTEFSPNSVQLYFSTLGGTGLYQYSLDTFDSASILTSKYIHPGPSLFALQIGLDHKIYGTRSFLTHLSRIENPNDTGSNVIHTQNAVFLNGDTAGLGLPDFIQSYFHPAYFDYTSRCDEPVHFSANTTGIDSLLWDFGDSLNAINSSTVSPVQHQYLTQGYHTVTLNIYIGGEEYTFSRQVYARFGIKGGSRDSIGICTDSMLVSTPSQIPFASYLWQNGDTNSSIWVTEAGEYYCTIAGQCGAVLDTLVVFDGYLDPVDLGNDTSMCAAASFVKSVAQPQATYLWNTGDTTFAITIDTAGTYSVTVYGLCDTLSDQLVVSMNAVGAGIIQKGPINTPVVLTATSGTNFLWSTGDTTQSISAASPGTYSVTYLGEDGCEYEASITLKEKDFLAIESLKNQLTFELYPNPTKSDFFILIKHAGEFDYRIRDVAGKTVQQGVLTSGSPQRINLNYGDPGLYIITVENDKSTSQKRFVICSR